jgi:hypothetical protein
MRGEKEMSKLVKRLRQVCECSSHPIGFKRSTVESSRQMLLIASLPQGKRGMVTNLNLAEVDALLFHSRDLGGSEALEQIWGGVGDTPWGVWLGTGEPPDLKQFMEVGGDFIAMESAMAPAELLREDMGKILKVDLSRERFLLSAMSDLPVDAVLMDLGGKKGDLTVADIMHCQWLSNLLDKPLLVAANRELSDKEIWLIWDVGVSGIVIEIGDESGAEVLSRQFQAISDLPPRTRKRGDDHVLLPSFDIESDED